MTSIPPRNKVIKSSDTEVYRDFIEAKARRSGISDILLKHGISRSKLYNIIRSVRHGNSDKIDRDMKKARLTALWEHKYKVRFLSLPKNRMAETVKELRALIREMHKDGFSQHLIAQLLEKDRSTIIHHLA